MDGHSSGVLAAVAIVLLWLAGVAFFIAFEGAAILGSPVDLPGGAGTNWFATVISGLAGKAKDLQGGTG